MSNYFENSGEKIKNIYHRQKKVCSKNPENLNNLFLFQPFQQIYVRLINFGVFFETSKSLKNFIFYFIRKYAYEINKNILYLKIYKLYFKWYVNIKPKILYTYNILFCVTNISWQKSDTPAVCCISIFYIYYANIAYM